MRKINTLIGSPVPRVEDPRFLRGQGRYVDDIGRDGMLHAAILRSAIAHGRIRAVDAGRARAMAGVHAVITAADIAAAVGAVPDIPIRLAPMPALQDFVQPVIATTKVRFVGEPVAVVVADNPALAEDALAAVDVDIENLPAVIDRQAAEETETPLFEDVDRGSPVKYVAGKGDADAAFACADYVRRERFGIHRQAGYRSSRAASSPNGTRPVSI